MRKHLVFVFIFSLMVACVAGAEEFPPPTLSPENVKSVAAAFLEQRQVDIAEYEMELLGFDYVKRTWRLMFTGKSGVLHDTYWIVVADDEFNEISLREN